MIAIYKNRKLDSSKPVQVYRNLTKNCWSLRQDRLVVAHADELCLISCKFKVIEKYRRQVVKTRRKNVHAWVVGYFLALEGTFNCRNVSYNPYTNQFFVNSDNQPVNKADAVFFDKFGKVFYETA